MRLSLIGMSGSGKSYWALKLAEQGFRRFCCDELIAAKLAPELRKPNGTIMSLGEWMGFPYQSQYKKREARYLNCEIEVLKEVLEHLENSNNDLERDLVIDTTGSVIYTGESILARLRQYTTIAHIATPPEVQEEMLKAYVANQRPVLWRDFFFKQPNETNKEALARCYPGLLLAREQLYKKYSDLTIEYYRSHEVNFGVRDLLAIIRIGKA